MTTEQKIDSFGQYLQSARKAAGLDIDGLSAKTKISSQVIRQIENEDHDHLPDPAFVKGFLRLYAVMTGCDGHKAVDLYLESRARHEKEMALRSGRQNGGRFWVNMLISLGALGGIMVLSLYMIPDSGPPKRVEESLDYSIETMALSQAPVSTVASEDEPEADQAPAPPVKKWLLGVHAVEETWLKILVDDKPSKEYRLKRGDRLELAAAEYFNLLLGSATGAKLTLNGKPVTIQGKSGQIVNLDLP